MSDMMTVRAIREELERIEEEFGDVPAELLDTLDMEMRQPITHVRFDQERQRACFLSDR